MLHGIQEVQTLAETYVASQDLPCMTKHYVDVPMREAYAIAYLYEDAISNPDNEYTRHCYEMLRHELKKQYTLLLQHGYTFEYSSEDAYKNSQEMIADVRDNKHLTVFNGGDVHPLLGEDNLIFRAVHDVFGHCAIGYGFGAKGEHNAWIHHSMMFSYHAQMALTTETRGQNSWVNFYGGHEYLKAQDRPFAQQKVFILPSAYTTFAVL